MSSNGHGFSNEKQIVEEINKDDPNENIKSFEKFLSEKETLDADDLHAEVVSNNNYKADITIEAEGRSIGVSIKEGNANSVHQEKVENFNNYIQTDEEIDGVTDKVIEYFEWFINSKKNATTLKKNHSERLDTLKEFLDKNSMLLAERFVKTGDKDRKEAEYLYYGTSEDGSWAEADKALAKAVNRNNGMATLPIGSLTLQAWNRTNEEKRYTLQVKWGRIEKDLNSARKEGSE